MEMRRERFISERGEGFWRIDGRYELLSRWGSRIAVTNENWIVVWRV